MRIGDLRKRVTLQTESSVSDNAGGYTLSWADVATVWADIVPTSMSEVIMAQRLEGHVTHRVTIRYRSDITADMRVMYGARIFNVRGYMNKDENNRWIELLVEEGSAV